VIFLFKLACSGLILAKIITVIKMTFKLKILLPGLILVGLLLAVWSHPGKADDLPDSAYVSGLLGHPQRFMLSCESRSAVDWAAYWGVTIDEAGATARGLPRSRTYPLGSFLTSWETLGNMAVTGSLEGGRQPAEPPSGEESYSVQPGDYLMELARRFNTTWENLANLNNLAYPYTIHPGQILMLPGSPENMQPPQDNQAPPPVAPTPAPVEDFAGEYVVHLPVIYGIQPVADPGELEQEPAFPETYTVQPGEYLVELAQRFGLDWQELAELNGIAYPYVIFAGQELRLR
jgi:LysM repeat protein